MVVLTLDRPQRSLQPRRRWPLKDVSAQPLFQCNTLIPLFVDTLSFPNYTGSPGYGEQFIQDLVGRCGELDVQDCIASARHLIKLGISEAGPGKQFITGGSHGGFLGAHRT